jgi:hypothetical protein
VPTKPKARTSPAAIHTGRVNQIIATTLRWYAAGRTPANEPITLAQATELVTFRCHPLCAEAGQKALTQLG